MKHLFIMLALVSMGLFVTACGEEGGEEHSGGEGNESSENAEGGEGEAEGESEGEAEGEAEAEPEGEAEAGGGEEAAAGGGGCSNLEACCNGYVEAMRGYFEGLPGGAGAAGAAGLENACQGMDATAGAGNEEACNAAIGSWRQALQAQSLEVPAACGS